MKPSDLADTLLKKYKIYYRCDKCWACAKLPGSTPERVYDYGRVVDTFVKAWGSWVKHFLRRKGFFFCLKADIACGLGDFFQLS